MAIRNKDRFEVFKRDKFTCQYCGRKAPDVILEIDHILPRAEDGADDIINLVTSCWECNSGKGPRTLSDDTVIEKQRQQLERLQERREQLEMMVEWQRSLLEFNVEIQTRLGGFWAELTPGYHLTALGENQLQTLIRRYDVDEIMEAMTTSARQYLVFTSDDFSKPTGESVEKAWDYVSRIIVTRRRTKEKPYLRQLYYIRGILKNRCNYVNEWESIEIMESALRAGHTTDEIKAIALQVTSWTQFRTAMEEIGG